MKYVLKSINVCHDKIKHGKTLHLSDFIHNGGVITVKCK